LTRTPNGAPLGVLNATDTASATTAYVTLSPPFDPAGVGTFGVFLTETLGDMKVDTVHSKGNASLATVAGSIVDARSGGAGLDIAGVIGNTIDLYAKAGSIGDPSGGNDLEIDSQRYFQWHHRRPARTTRFISPKSAATPWLSGIRIPQRAGRAPASDGAATPSAALRGAAFHCP